MGKSSMEEGVGGPSSIGHGRSQNHLPVCKRGIPVWRRGWGGPSSKSSGIASIIEESLCTAKSEVHLRCLEGSLAYQNPLCMSETWLSFCRSDFQLSHTIYKCFRGNPSNQHTENLVYGGATSKSDMDVINLYL